MKAPTPCGLHCSTLKADNGINMLIKAVACVDKSIANDNNIVHVLPPDINTKVKKNNISYNYTSVHGYDYCIVCAKKVALTKDGALRKHQCAKAL